MMPKVLFSEVQYFRQSPLWVLLLLIPVFVLGSILIYQLGTGTLVGDRPVSNLALSVLIAVVVIPSFLAIARVKLTTIIDDEKIRYGWNMPTPELNEVRLDDIAEWSIIKYDFVGYGYRISTKYGTVHNMRGNRGLFIVTKSGERVLIGTQKLRELSALLDSRKVITTV